MGINLKRCILCKQIDKLTAEHKIKASLLKYFNKLENTDSSGILKYDNGTSSGGEFSNIDKARILRPRKNICSVCNSQRSSECDQYFHDFVIDAFNHQKSVPEIDILTSPSQKEIFEQMELYREGAGIGRGDWIDSYLYVNSKYFFAQKYQIFSHSYDSLLIKKYLAKHTACYLDRCDLKVPNFLCDIFMTGDNHELLTFDILYMSKDFHHGYQNSLIRYPDVNIEYSLIFSNMAIKVTIPAV